MGRFYQTSQPRFVDNKMYEAPLELMQETLQLHEGRTDNLMASADILEGAADQIQHLNFDAENERVANLQNKYNTAIDGLTDKILENPLEYQKHAPALKKLKRQMAEDQSSGEWYQIQKRLGDYQNWMKENEDKRKDSPDLYNKLNRHYYNDLVSRATDDAEATFQGQRVIDRPDLIKGYREVFENIKANSIQQSDGKYLYKNKELTEDEVANIAWNTLKSDKDYQGYVNQMGNTLGERGYVDDEGRALDAFNLVDGNGKVVSFEEYEKLPAEEKSKVSRQLNPGNAFYGDLASVAQTYGFNEQEMTTDQYGLATHKGRITSGHIAQRANNAIELEGYRQGGRMDLLERKYELMGEQDQFDYKADLELKAANGDEGAQNMLNSLTAKETIGVIGNPSKTLGEDLRMMQMIRQAAPDMPEGSQAMAYAPPGTAAYAAQQRWKDSTDKGMKAQGDTDIELTNGSSFKAQEYFEWLGERRHSESLARDFLENKSLRVQTESGGDVSTAQSYANDWRWSPEWSKSDAAVVWDKLYEAGNKFEEERDKYYEDYSNSANQISLQPINDPTVNKNMVDELRRNPENYYMVDAEGNIAHEYRESIKNIDPNSQLYVTAANSHSEMAIEVEDPETGESYYIFPNQGNNAPKNLAIGLAMQGVDQESQFYQEMEDRQANFLTQQMVSTGKNKRNTYSIVTDINGKELSLELVGDEVLVRDPDAGLNSDPEDTYKNMHHFLNTMYAKE